MKKTAQDFGSNWEVRPSRVRTEESAETTCDSEVDYLGFRLVHDNTDRVYRGGSWSNTADYARAAVRYWDVPGRRGDILGLRLCVNWRE
jgi:formylglycine-generating enzyme required for sulfatase activity